MNPQPEKHLHRKRFLFVDDDPELLAAYQQVFTELSRGAWEIATAKTHAQALKTLADSPVAAVVLDIGMPVMDGIELLRLLRLTHPGQVVVMLTGRTDEQTRRTCLENGAALFLDKLLTPEGYETVFAALEALTDTTPQAGFRGMMRRVGLQDVLQMECLGRKSSVLEVFARNIRGRIYIAEGQIVHAEAGTLQGEVALYGLLGLHGGEFNLQPFSEPSRRTIAGHYEFLLMEAARLSDEGTTFLEAGTARSPAPESTATQTLMATPDAEFSMVGAEVQIKEVVLCSGAGEVLHDWGCESLDQRLRLLAQLEQQAIQLGDMLSAGRFERLEMHLADGRLVCQVEPHMRLLVRSTQPPVAVSPT